MIDYIKILAIFYPGTQWAISGDEYDGLEWNDPSPKPTKEELDNLWPAAQEAQQKKYCKEKAKQLIADADWSALPDVGLVNQADFIAYRAALRALIINPVADPVWPTEPTPEWG